MYTMLFNVLVLTIVLCAHSGQCIQCFECNYISSPELCTNVKTCSSSEICHIEQVVTDLAEIVYNTGCINKLQCHNKKRAVGSPATGITTCNHCCSTDYCNKYGCGIPDVPRDQRGPHCFTCDSHTSAGGCKNITTCADDESCLIHVPSEYAFLSVPLYRSQCEPTQICAALEIAEHEGPCPARCCDDDYCNDQCLYTGVITTTSLPVVVTTTSMGPSQLCDLVGYTEFQYGNEPAMCIKVHLETKDFIHALAQCQVEGASLIATQTSGKQAVLKQYLTQQNLAHHDYWIGLYDKDGSDAFVWVTGDPLTDSDWGTKPQQPTHVYSGQDEDCVEMYHGEPFLWHDTWCSHQLSFICEKR